MTLPEPKEGSAMFARVTAYLAKNILVRLLIETFLAIFRRISWGDVIARLAMRSVKTGLRYLASRTENKVDDQLVEDIITSLEGKDVPRV
jgi:hypothetical protein